MRVWIAILLLITCVIDGLQAAHFRGQAWQAERGVLESIRIEPRLPLPGEGFTAKLTGSWPEKDPRGNCWGPLEISAVEVLAGNRVQLISNMLDNSSNCDELPANWSLEVEIPASAWDAVDEKGFLIIENLLYSGINMLTGIQQVFDLRLGTHEIPAFLGSGFWVSPDSAFEGVMVEQQGSRVLFYGLAYDRDISLGDEGEPVWQMVTGEMYGNSTLGRSARYDWPVAEGRLPEEIPEHDEILTVNDSGSIIVDDYNHIQVFTKIGNEEFDQYKKYHRLVFGHDSSRIPVYVPPLAGRWTLHGFVDQSAEFTTTMEFGPGQQSASDQYLFKSTDDDWSAQCTVTPPGSGECRFERHSDGIVFQFPLTAFQGNLARGELQLKSGVALDGVLARQPWQLPVLETR
jgi:hypothetical protein